MFKYDRLRICAAPSISAQFTNKLQRKQIEQEPFLSASARNRSRLLPPANF